MTKDTKRIEEIIERLKVVRELIRAELIEGRNFDHVFYDLEKHEIAFTQRLLELREHNARIAGAEKK